MQHIDPVRISALADEPATLLERTHLAECALCNAELASAQRVIRMAMTDTPAIERPITSWARLGPALRAEGLITIPATTGEFDASIAPIASRRAAGSRWMMQAAAGVFLAVGGAVLGRASVAMPGEGAQVASAREDTIFGSTAEAMDIAQKASDQYQRAVMFLAANDSSVTMRGSDAAELLNARLDAIDQSVAATTAALSRAPGDPVLSNLYRQIGGVRSLTLRQMGQVVPVSSSTRTRF
jgi:hypothetical protein